jgi:hypothetical protein
VRIRNLHYQNTLEFRGSIHYLEIRAASIAIFTQIQNTPYQEPRILGGIESDVSDFVWIIRRGPGFLAGNGGTAGYLGGWFRDMVSDTLHGLNWNNQNTATFSIENAGGIEIMRVSIYGSPLADI